MAKRKSIANQSELMDELHIHQIDKIKDDSVQEKLFELARQGRLSDNLIKELIRAVPELTKAFGAYVVALSEVGCHVEMTKQARWEVLKECAKNRTLTGDQILEAMKIVQECEKNDPKIDWEKVSDVAAKIGKGVAVVAMVIAAGLLWALANSSDNSKS